MAEAKKHKLGSGLQQYRDGKTNVITLVVTQACNLKCRYCYMVDKNKSHVMPKEVGYKAIDYALNLPNPLEAVNLDFVGGEATLEMDLLESLSEYFRDQLEGMPCHPWKDAFVITVGTNGTTYRSKRFQRFLWRHRGHIWPALTIDGPKEKHDMHRIFNNGHGSFDTVFESAKLWVRQYWGAGPKVTFSSDDIHLLCDSIVWLWEELGVDIVAANVVYEDVWKPGDDVIFEKQLRRLADISIDKGYWKHKNTTLFWEPTPIDVHMADDRNWCGTGKMLAIDSKGDIYPCVRFMDYSLGNPDRKARIVGNIYDGLDENKLRAYMCLRRSLQSPQECIECMQQDYCSWCSGYNYDAADSDTMFQRSTANCAMHKAQHRANDYYWKRLEEKCGVVLDASNIVHPKRNCLL